MKLVDSKSSKICTLPMCYSPIADGILQMGKPKVKWNK